MAIIMCTIELKGAKFIVVYVSHCCYVIRPQDSQVQAVYIAVPENIWVFMESFYCVCFSG